MLFYEQLAIRRTVLVRVLLMFFLFFFFFYIILLSAATYYTSTYIYLFNLSKSNRITQCWTMMVHKDRMYVWRRMVRLGNTSMPRSVLQLNAWTIFWKEKNRPNEYDISLFSNYCKYKSSWRIIRKKKLILRTKTETNNSTTNIQPLG